MRPTIHRRCHRGRQAHGGAEDDTHFSITGFGPTVNHRPSTTTWVKPRYFSQPTGAGKTTILDAICYALHDRATWKSRG